MVILFTYVMSSHGLLKMFMSIGFLTNVLPGYFCPALAKAVKTMKKAEKVLLTVKPQCEFLFQSLIIILQVLCLILMNYDIYLNFLTSNADGFGEKGRPAAGEEGDVPPNATLVIDLELVSWKTVTEIGDDKKILKKVLKEGEGYERPNEGAVVEGTIKWSSTQL
jgi:FK506-binding protein 4/5